MKTHQTAAEAIEHSKAYGEMGHCVDTTANHKYLAARCDGVANGEDYWADDPDSDLKMAWRVLVVADA